MKRRFALGLALTLALALCLGATVLAEADGYWTSNEDLYYHVLENCGGGAGRVPISEEGAAEFGKYPCPVCLPGEDDAEPPSAVARGGIICARFSDAWMAQQEFIDVPGSGGRGIYEGADADSKLAQMLRGEAYARFLETGAETWAPYPSVLGMDEAGKERFVWLDKRHIGSHWYALVQPIDGFGRDWDMHWQVEADRVWMENGEMVVAYEERETAEEVLTLTPTRLETEAVYNREGAPSVSIYEAGDVYVAVIREHDADEYLLEGVRLRLRGTEFELADGRMSGADGLYYALIDEAELNALREGASVELLHPALTDESAYMGTPYAVADYGSSGRVGILDREGNWAVEPTYRAIYRPDPEQHPITTPRHFFCQREDGSSVILNGETLEVMFESAYGTQFENPAMYREITNGDYYTEPCTFRSLRDGGVLFEYPGEEEQGWTPDGRYRVLADGEPERMVATKGSGENVQMSLIDNRGELIPDTVYQRLTALYWRGGRGVFLAERFEPGEYDFDGFGGQLDFENGGPYDGREVYGSHWRCGLIDEDGAELLEMKYVSIACGADGTIRLTTEDGNEETHTLDELLGEGA